jgi:predicted transcriptional regulator
MLKTLPFSIRLRPELKKWLQKLAEIDRRSLTNYVEIVLEDHVARMAQASAMGKKRGDSDGTEATR